MIQNMKSKIKKKTYKAIYRLLDRVSPLDTDCGLLCGAACCTCGGDAVNADGSLDEDGLDYELGIYLLPGEEKLFTMREEWLKWSVEYAEDFDFPASWFGKIYFVRCKTPPVCPRKSRPLQCRFFPLAPHLTEDGRLQLILSTAETPYACPLIAANRTGSEAAFEPPADASPTPSGAACLSGANRSATADAQSPAGAARPETEAQPAAHVLNDRFIRATYTVWKHLLTDPLICDLVVLDSEDRRQAGLPLTVVK